MRKKRKKLSKDDLDRLWRRILGTCIFCGRDSKGYFLRKGSDLTEYTFPYYVRVKRSCVVCFNCREFFDWLLGDPTELCRKYPEYFEIYGKDQLAIRRMKWEIAYFKWKNRRGD